MDGNNREYSSRMEGIHNNGFMRGGVLKPVSFTAVGPGEKGSARISITAEMAPVAGRLFSDVGLHVQSVFVPCTAMHALKYPDAPYAGTAEGVRQMIKENDGVVWPLEDDNDFAKSARIHPRKINGVAKVSEAIRLSHNVAVNHLRRMTYHKSVQLDADNTAITPAILKQTSLQRFSGVLDPDENVDGAVNLDGEMKIRGIGKLTDDFPVEGQQFTEPDGTVVTYDGAQWIDGTTNARSFVIEEDPETPGKMNLRAVMQSDSISLRDFSIARQQDEITRRIDAIMRQNPEYGQDMVWRWFHRLELEGGRYAGLLYDREVSFNKMIEPATDGPSLGDEITQVDRGHDFAVPLPRTELGGVIVTFITIRPDEVMPPQPHPMLSETWVQPNYEADKLRLEPEPFTYRDQWSDVETVNENTRSMYIGYNHDKKYYSDYGFARDVDLTTVENESSIWQVEVPLSVTPDNVLYPENIDHAPFSDRWGDAARFSCSASVMVETPLVFGPTPVERVLEIEENDLFEKDDDDA